MRNLPQAWKKCLKPKKNRTSRRLIMASEWITSTSVRELRTFSCAPNRSRVGAKWPCEKVIVVCNNLNTHTKGAFYEALIGK